MTHVTIYRNKENECIGFTVIGHAEYAEAGEDIICAGISMLVINTCNAIEALTTAKRRPMNLEGPIDLRLKRKPDEGNRTIVVCDDSRIREYGRRSGL